MVHNKTFVLYFADEDEAKRYAATFAPSASLEVTPIQVIGLIKAGEGGDGETND